MLPLIGALGSALVGGVANAWAVRETNKANIAQAREQMAFQDIETGEARQFAKKEAKKTRQAQSREAKEAFKRELYASNTAYQRATADMRKAGINPMLAYMKGGAEGVSGQMASQAQASGVSAPQGSKADIQKANYLSGLQDVFSNAMDVKRLKNETGLNEAMKLKEKTQALENMTNAYRNKLEYKVRLNTMKADIARAVADARMADFESKHIKTAFWGKVLGGLSGYAPKMVLPLGRLK